MKTSVELQAPFQYMILWLILAVLFIAGVIIAQVLLRKKLGDRLKKAKQIKLKRIAESTLEGLKKKSKNNGKTGLSKNEYMYQTVCS